MSEQTKASSQQRILDALREARSRLEEVEREKTEPIAIVGMGCRFPGGVDNPDAYWDLLRNGVDAMKEVPKDRWDIDAYYDADSTALGKIYTRDAGFLDQVDQFDPDFFRISPREALSMDPQQRLLLEVVWEALEDAGQSADQIRGSNTGFFMGLSWHDYERNAFGMDPERLDAYAGMGNTPSIAVGRLAYVLGVHGPTMQLDTACSSSLVSVHVACQSLRAGECTMALAGGVNLMISPLSTIFCCAINALSPAGRCKTFDAGADGYARGEGCGVVVLKRLRDALADNDHIRAVIRGSAINHDGPSSGLTVPSRRAQQRVIEQALQNSRVDSLAVSYVEAHGTGTALGDPIEIGALGDSLGRDRPENKPLLVGSVKTNFGHLEAAAGIAGLMKVVLALENGEIPAHLHFHDPSSNIDWDEFPVQIPTEKTPWRDRPCIAGVSSFGFSGTNAHVILEEAPERKRDELNLERSSQMLCLSAKSETALKALAGRYDAYFKTHPESVIGDVCFTANAGRAHFGHRLVVVGDTVETLRTGLEDYVIRGTGTSVQQNEAKLGESLKVAFLFTGQGSQWVGMGRELYETQASFRRDLEHCEEVLREYKDRPLLEVMFGNKEDEGNKLLDETAYTQPALFALEYSLAQLWRSWGIEPAVLMGHSVGEYVAACLAGVFTLEDGLKLVAERGRLMQSLPHEGEMVAVRGEERRVSEIIAPYTSEVSLAAVNGPTSVVLSGQREAMREIVEKLNTAGMEVRPLQVSHAFHSPLMEPMLKAFEEVASTVHYSPPRIAMVSNVTGKMAGEEVTRSQYWVNHVRQTVQFASGMETLHANGYKVYLEVGPQPTLLGMGRQCVPEESGEWLPSLRKGRTDWNQMLTTLGALYVRGASIDWPGFERDYRHYRLPLPTYPFQYQRYWIEDPAAKGHLEAIQNSRVVQMTPLNSFLGHRVHSAGLKEGVIQFETVINSDLPSYLRDHRVYDTLIVPATAYIEMALEAARDLFSSGMLLLEDVSIQKPLILPESGDKTIQILLTPEGNHKFSFEIFSLQNDNIPNEPVWLLHANGYLSNLTDSGLPAKLDISYFEPVNAEKIPIEHIYKRFLEQGLELGPSFQCIEKVWVKDNEIFGSVKLPDAASHDVGNEILHPVLLDGCGQALASIFHTDKSDDVFLPVEIERLESYQCASRLLRFRGKIRPEPVSNSQIRIADLDLFDEFGEPVARVQSSVTRRAQQELMQQHIRPIESEWLYELTWRPQPLQAPKFANSGENKEENWLVLADNSGTGFLLAELLKQHGNQCCVVYPGETFLHVEGNHYQINPGKPQDFIKLHQEYFDDGQPAWRGIVHLWGLESSVAQVLMDNSLDLMVEHACCSFLNLIKALIQASSNTPPQVFLVTQGSQVVESATLTSPAQASLWGMGRTLALEYPEYNCVLVDLEPGEVCDKNCELLLAELTGNSGYENQVAYRQGARQIAQLISRSEEVSIPPTSLEPHRLGISEYGLLENLAFVPAERNLPGAHQVEIEIRATGLNFRDVLYALGMLNEQAEALGIDSPTEMTFGFECSGRVSAIGSEVSEFQVGDVVIATHTEGALGNYVTQDIAYVAPIPLGLGFAEAATIPIAFLTAYYGLITCAQLRAGERVLIHAAAGGVGQAAIQIVRQVGADILATASPGKWRFLESIGIEKPMNSRDLEFVDQIRQVTDGKGVDVVLNCLNGEFIPASIDVLGENGRFVELGKLGIWSDEEIKKKRPDIEYFPFDLGDICRDDPSQANTMLTHLVGEFNSGRLKPLPHQFFPMEHFINAFQNMAKAKHVGKLVICQSPINHSWPMPDTTLARSDSSYLITGGLGGLGLKAAEWLTSEGAQHLVLIGRTDATDTQLSALEGLEHAGTKVKVIKADISKRSDVEKVLAIVRESLPPIRGIIHAAGVLNDGAFLQQDWKRFEQVFAAKISGAWHLHRLTMTEPLDFFVCFSSAASLLGSRGQANYAAANSFLDAFAHFRRAQGLPAISVNWGPWAEVGMASKMLDRDQQRLQSMGWGSIEPEKGFRILGQMIRENATQFGVLPLNWSKFVKQFEPHATPAFFSEVSFEPQSISKTSEISTKQSVKQQLKAASTDEQPLIVKHYLEDRLVHVLGQDASQLPNMDQSFSEFGLDSLMQMELRSYIAKDLGISLPMGDFINCSRLSDLATLLGRHLTLQNITEEQNGYSSDSDENSDEIVI